MCKNNYYKATKLFCFLIFDVNWIENPVIINVNYPVAYILSWSQKTKNQALQVVSTLVSYGMLNWHLLKTKLVQQWLPEESGSTNLSAVTISNMQKSRLFFLNALQKGQWLKKAIDSRKRHVDHNASKEILALCWKCLLASYNFIQNNSLRNVGLPDIGVGYEIFQLGSPTGRALCRIKLLPVTCFGGHMDVNC